MSAIDSTADVEYRQLSWAPGYRFGSDGSIWSNKYPGQSGGAWTRRLAYPNRKGYPKIVLFWCNRGYTFYVHRLICEAFHGPCPPGLVTCHFPDRNPANCHASNLRWDTHQANSADMDIHGTRIRMAGEKNGRSKLKSEDVIEIRRLLEVGKSIQSVADQFSMDHKTISEIKQGVIWKHVVS